MQEPYVLLYVQLTWGFDLEYVALITTFRPTALLVSEASLSCGRALCLLQRWAERVPEVLPRGVRDSDLPSHLRRGHQPPPSLFISSVSPYRCRAKPF